MSGSITIARVFGIPVRIDITWLVIFAILLIPGGAYYLPNQFPGWSTAAVWTVAGVYTLLFFASILIHELSHALVAKLHGIPVKSITLWLFGGVAHLTKAAQRPRAEVLVSVVGPLSNVAIAGGLAVYLFAIGAGNQYVEVLAVYLLGANVILAAFNLLPGLPLDGGQLVRSAVWAITSNREKGTVYAALGGCGVALLVCCGGFAFVYFQGQWLSGLWLGFIGFWMLMTAVSTFRGARKREAIGRFRAYHVMSPYTGEPSPPDAPRIPTHVNALALLDFMNENRVHRAFVTDGTRIVGVVETQPSPP